MHRIFTRHRAVASNERLQIPLIKHCIRATLQAEGVDVPCELSVLITDDKGIKNLNRDYRGVNSSTDVLSFPMLEYSAPGWDARMPDVALSADGVLPFGDIVLSAEKIKEQAKENGNTRERETAYLTIHSVLHLLGYDHVDEGEGKQQMREREKAILSELGF
ncbi:MAG: rRNA maturation RNase YbeY [Oscillospiraceae bacterium]|nr:rRNA maturation RNase YbeY [Oscillospiraceae bacterium]